MTESLEALSGASEIGWAREFHRPVTRRVRSSAATSRWPSSRILPLPLGSGRSPCGGRAELGLGAGAFWDAIAANGGPRLTPGQGIDALSEAIDIIRAIWNAEGPPVRHRDRYYTVDGAHPGPPPCTTSKSGWAPTSHGC
jgi:Luciferase-like monooxygenase